MNTDSGYEATPTGIARAAFTVLGRDPEQVASSEPIAGGIGACDAYAVTTSSGETFILKAQLPGSDPQMTSALRREALFYSRLAARVPLRTPCIVSISTNERNGIVVLMEHAAPSPPAASWTDDLYTQAARDLGQLHAAFWDGAALLESCRFLGRHGTEISEAEIQAGRDSWDSVARMERFQDVMTQDRVSAIEAWIPTASQVQPLLAALPPTLIHGDCASGNVLISSDGSLIWANWSGASIGRGPEDLSFLYQRSAFSGGTPPWDAMLTAYHESLQANLGQPVDPDALRQAAEASEWTVRLLQWPHYMDFASPETLQAFLCRLDELAESLGSVIAA